MIFTIGYEGISVNGLLSVLRHNDVDVVVDVRLTPLSRKRGFSKRALAVALQERGLRYSHRPEFGCPKDIRTRLEATGDFAEYADSYATRVLSRRTVEVGRLAREGRARNICLLCFEADASRCHRSLIAARAGTVSQGATGAVHLAAGRTSRQS